MYSSCCHVVPGDVGTRCHCPGGAKHCILDEKLRCREKLAALSHSEELQSKERRLRHSRRKNRRHLKKLLKKWLRDEKKVLWYSEHYSGVGCDVSKPQNPEQCLWCLIYPLYFLWKHKNIVICGHWTAPYMLYAVKRYVTQIIKKQIILKLHLTLDDSFKIFKLIHY